MKLIRIKEDYYEKKIENGRVILINRTWASKMQIKAAQRCGGKTGGGVCC
jgi:hypothetical protein